SGMTNGYRCICPFCLLEKHQRYWFAHNVASPDHNNLRTLCRNIALYEQLLDAQGRARIKVGISDHKPSHIDRMKAIYILCWQDCVKYIPLIDMRWQWKLNKNSVDIICTIIFVNYRY